MIVKLEVFFVDTSQGLFNGPAVNGISIITAPSGKNHLWGYNALSQLGTTVNKCSIRAFSVDAEVQCGSQPDLVLVARPNLKTGTARNTAVTVVTKACESPFDEPSLYRCNAGRSTSSL